MWCANLLSGEIVQGVYFLWHVHGLYIPVQSLWFRCQI